VAAVGSPGLGEGAAPQSVGVIAALAQPRLGFESHQVEVTGRYSNRQITQIAAKLVDFALENPA
jgi:hypothetical protein